MNGSGSKFILADRFIFDSVSNFLIDKNFDDEFIRLGSNESRILLMLSLRPNEVITRDELYDFVWREQGFEVDDSSLTQAISTLRKQLKDSTKSPQFIKTVPKRGYQFIATVALPSDEEETNEDINELVDTTPDKQTELELPSVNREVEPVPDLKPEKVDITISKPVKHSPKKRSIDIVSKLILLVAVLLPIFAVLHTSPAPSEFRTLANYDGVAVNTPLNHPDLSNWLPSIELCIYKYKEKYQQAETLEKVIATGGDNDVLVLNYIHQPQDSSANITLKIVAKPEQINQVCHRGTSS